MDKGNNIKLRFQPVPSAEVELNNIKPGKSQQQSLPSDNLKTSILLYSEARYK